MGNLSEVYGELKLKPGAEGKLEQLREEEELSEEELGLDGDKLILEASGWRMYLGREIFDKLAKIADGVISITGEEWSDRWRIKLENGRVYISLTKISAVDLPFTDDEKVLTSSLGTKKK